MLAECMDFFEKHLKDSGIKSRVYRTEKRLLNANESHIGAVLFQGEKWTPCKVTREFEKDSVPMKRTKIWERVTTLSVVIGDYTMPSCVKVFDEFMKTLPKGFYLDENWVGFEVKDVDWAEDEDSLLKSKTAVQILITCEGGMYVDTPFVTLKSIDLKEEQHG
jgi:hypothetical protein